MRYALAVVPPLSSEHELRAADNERCAQLRRRGFDGVRSARGKLVAQRRREHRRVGRIHVAVEANRPYLTGFLKPAMAPKSPSGGRSSGNRPDPRAVAKLSRVIIASGLSHAARVFL